MASSAPLARGRMCRSTKSLVIWTAASIFVLTLLHLTLSPSRLPHVSPLFRPFSKPIELSHAQLSSLAKPPSTSNATFDHDDDDEDDDETTGNRPHDRRLRIFMPADSPNINLCKTIMSGVGLGYPVPTLLNWDGDFNRPEWHFAGSHIAKLESLLAVIEEVLRSAEDAHEDDLALMVDAYDIWFQLPPTVLIQRFHQLNREADERNRRLWEQASAVAGFPIPPPQQSVIVTAAKDCFPDSSSGSDPHYEHWPESPMPTDMYGEETDKLQSAIVDSARKYHTIRPRCVNSGMIMGTMGAMRDALQRCKNKIEDVARAGRQLWSDQALLAEVIGDQEAYREWVRSLAESWNGTSSHSDPAEFDSHVAHIAEAAMRGVNFEFGIGLDYNFTTIPPTCSSEEDGYFVRIEDSESLKNQSELAGVPGGVRVEGIPPELYPGFDNDDDPLADVVWGDEPLYTDFFFGTTPVGIHHNAYIQNLKPWRLENWWDKMWFYPQLRALVTQNLRVSSLHPRVLVNLTTDEGEGVVYKAPKEHRVTVYNPARGDEPAAFQPIDWRGVCQNGPEPWHDKLFGDRRGPLPI